MKTVFTAFLLVAFLFLLGFLSSAIADDELNDSISRGKTLATNLCSRCHAVGETGKSPRAKAPPFRTFAKMWPVEQLAESLAEGIVTGHDEMPEFVFIPEEIDDFLNYLRSISPAP